MPQPSLQLEEVLQAKKALLHRYGALESMTAPLILHLQQHLLYQGPRASWMGGVVSMGVVMMAPPQVTCCLSFHL
jgi:hypothetical protein